MMAVSPLQGCVDMLAGTQGGASLCPGLGCHSPSGWVEGGTLWAEDWRPWVGVGVGVPKWSEDVVFDPGSGSPRGSHSLAQGRAQRRPGLRVFFRMEPCKGGTGPGNDGCFALTGLR